MVINSCSNGYNYLRIKKMDIFDIVLMLYKDPEEKVKFDETCAIK